MSKLYQTDPRLPEQYHKTGCNFLAHLGLVQSDLKRYLSPHETEEIGTELRRDGQITFDLCMYKRTSPYALFKKAFSVLGFPNRRGEQVGQIINGMVTFWKHVQEQHFHGVIAQLILPNGTLHFVECDRNFRIIYNPHPEVDQFRIYTYLLYKFWDKE